MALEIEKKEKTYKISPDIIVLIFLLFLFLVFLGSYFYFLFLETKIKKEISVVESNIENTQKKIEPLEKEAKKYQEKINNLKFLLDFHRLPLKVFEFLEKNTHPQVWFSSLDFNLEKNSLKIPGNAQSFEVLAQQILIFKNSEFVKNINLSKVNLGKEGGVSFDLELTIDPKIYKQ